MYLWQALVLWRQQILFLIKEICTLVGVFSFQQIMIRGGEKVLSLFLRNLSFFLFFYSLRKDD